MLLLAMIINYIDRAALSIAMPFITQDFHLTPVEKGLIFSAFSVGYAAFNVIGGYLADRFGGRRVLIWSMGGWSVVCAATAAAFNFWYLIVARALFGAGEGPNSATANKVVNVWFPLKERASAAGINQAGGPIGGALAGPVIGFMALWLGWRVAFVVMGVLGLLWVIAWARLVTETPAQHPKVSPEELALINEGRSDIPGANGEKASFGDVLRNRSVLLTGISLFCYNYILFFFMTWFPSYLVDAKGVSLQHMGIVNSLPWLVGAVGYLGGGILVDYIFRRTGKQTLSRKVVLVPSLLTAATCIGVTGLVDSVTVAVAVMTVAIGFLMLTAPAYWALIQDSVPSNQVGTASGFMHGLANLSGIVGPTITGYLIQQSGTYSTGFILAGALGIAGAMIVAFFVGRNGANAIGVARTA
ncbi:MFS transporter [Pantoea sp. Ap-967]|uniref:MFS transporter n=1 Tax=Pantoea sp. Ap-967 TaxID=2608362 RepID=UPI001F043ECB|nr:MFS transporter [Pantoea sp. Ap-967]